ncbi:Tfp pilus assembly protein FimT/FimU [Campylobacter sp. MOP7]|uniref:pilus assembly FimT family protein n=1 Tax=Campylobacter canis TaxID=3378588 RepID=UPI00387EE65B
MLKKAFTMIELVVVIVVIGILAAMAIPRLERDNLAEAVDQIVSHIRYTQHLAMQDNRFNTADSNWFRGYWRILFHSGTVTGEPAGMWRYTIFRDAGAYSGNPNSLNQIALDPLDPQKRLTSGFGNQGYPAASIKQNLNLTRTFDIVNITFNGCGANGTQTISFDNFGRPSGSMQGATRQHNRLFNANCVISLITRNGRTGTITIERETGFTRATVPTL